MASSQNLKIIKEETPQDVKVKNAAFSSNSIKRQVRYYTITKTNYFLNKTDEKKIVRGKYEAIDGVMFQGGKECDLPETFGDLKPHQKYEDYIYDFAYLKRVYREKMDVEIHDFHWLIHETDEHLVFYNIEVVGDCARVSTSISIKRNMQPVVALNGIVVDRLDYCALVPVTRKIVKWDQLRKLLVGFGSH